MRMCRSRGYIPLLRNTRKTVPLSSGPPQELRSFFVAWRRASAPLALPRARGSEMRSEEEAGAELEEASGHCCGGNLTDARIWNARCEGGER
jgi:hypothetical protein